MKDVYSKSLRSRVTRPRPNCVVLKIDFQQLLFSKLLAPVPFFFKLPLLGFTTQGLLLQGCLPLSYIICSYHPNLFCTPVIDFACHVKNGRGKNKTSKQIFNINWKNDRSKYSLSQRRCNSFQIYNDIQEFHTMIHNFSLLTY